MLVPLGHKRGAAMLELALLSPWIMFLFVGAFDFGFYAYSLISLETATRSAAVWNANHDSATDAGTACTIVYTEMQSVVNMQGVTGCSGSSPVRVTATKVKGPDGSDAAQVAVTYTTPRLLQIPGLLASQFTITRVITMKL